MAGKIDLNADLGESADSDAVARDVAMMEIISSANIACGGHAGDTATMRAMLIAAKAHGVCAGAHPSYPDRANFGRVSMAIEPRELQSSLEAQIADFYAQAVAQNIAVTHVKPHGALYNDAADDPALAAIIAVAVRNAAPNAALVGLAGSAMADAAARYGLRFIGEGFLDRRYTGHGRLVPRQQSGAVIEAQAHRIAQGLSLAHGKQITAIDGEPVSITAQTLCLHSDSAGALESASAVRAALEAAGIRIAAAA